MLLFLYLYSLLSPLTLTFSLSLSFSLSPLLHSIFKSVHEKNFGYLDDFFQHSLTLGLLFRAFEAIVEIGLGF